MAAALDINLFVHDGATTVGAAIDSVLAQSWQDWRLTLIDDGSTDGTAEILRDYAARDPRIAVKHNRANVGAVGAFQRGFWLGDAEFVMLKSADDLIAPEYVARLMAVLHAHPGCVMAHAGGLSFSGPGQLDFVYPESHRLHSVGSDRVARAEAVMLHYTSSPSFWGIYRRNAVDRLAPIAYRPGWDHVVLAELALYGEIRHDPGVMYWRRGTGRPVRVLARAAMAESARGVDPALPFAEALWRAPCLATAYAHVENFLLAPVTERERAALIAAARATFLRRWAPLMQREAETLRGYITQAVTAAALLDEDARVLALLPLTRLLAAMTTMLPGWDSRAEYEAVAGLLHQEAMTCPM